MGPWGGGRRDTTAGSRCPPASRSTSPRAAPATPIVLLHGFPESHRTWRHIIPDLARDHFVLAPDQRGFAARPSPRGRQLHARQVVGDLLALADLSASTVHAGRPRLGRRDRVDGGIAASRTRRPAGDRQRAAPVRLPAHAVRRHGPARGEPVHPRFRNPDREAHRRIGLSAFFDGSFMKHTDFDKIGRREAAPISTNGASPAR